MTIATTAVCEHCGLPVSAPHRHLDEAVFCCYGCEVASHILGKGDEGEARLTMYKLAAGVILGINVMMFSMPLYVESLGSFFRQGLGSDSYFELLKWLLMTLSIPVYFLLGMPFIESSLRNIRDGLRSNSDLLIAVGVSAAMLVSIFNTIFTSGPVYYETAVAILVIVTGGRYLEARARAKASRTIEALDASMPSIVSVITAEGTVRDVTVSSLREGDTILSKPGEHIPVDCIIRNGSAQVSEAMLTGEPNPVTRSEGDKLFGGSINYDGLLRLEVLAPETESYIAKLKRLLIESKQGRAPIQETADKIAARAIPIIITVAVGSFIYWSFAADLRHGLFAFLGVVLVACPCAIGIATPAALWIAVTNASQHGILFRSLGVVERLASVKNLFFDKTGTLTTGKPQVQSVSVALVNGVKEPNELSPYIGAVASLSSHPLSQAIARQFSGAMSATKNVTDLQEVASQGVSGFVNGVRIRIGSEHFVTDVFHPHPPRVNTTVWCSVADPNANETIYEFVLQDNIKPEAASAFAKLHSMGYTTTILSGDEHSVAERLANELHSRAMGKLAPEEKAYIVSSASASAFIGDGFNDAGAIGAASVGIAMGSGSDLLRSEADAILLDNNLLRMPQMLSLAKRTMRIVRQNLFWAFFYNVIGVGVAAVGLLNPIIAALAMALSSLAVAQNSLRLGRTSYFRTEDANA